MSDEDPGEALVRRVLEEDGRFGQVDEVIEGTEHSDLDPVRASLVAPLEAKARATRGPAQTGVKGVLRDARLDRERRRIEHAEAKEQQKAELLRQAGQFSVRPHDAEDAVDDEDDADLAAIRQRRLEQLMANAKRQRFGALVVLDRGGFVEQVENVPVGTFVVVHLFEEDLAVCQRMNHALATLATEFALVKFCCIPACETPGAFDRDTLPTLLVYKSGELHATIVRAQDEMIGDDFELADVQDLLEAYGVVDGAAVPAAVRQGPAVVIGGFSGTAHESDDDDDEFDD